MNSIAYNRDCLEAMREIPDRTFGLAIVDPPYGISVFGSYNRPRSNRARTPEYKPFAGSDDQTPCGEYFSELRRVSKNQIIWGGNYFADKLPPSMGWIYWDKMSRPSNFSDGELAYTSFNRALKKFKYLWAGFWQEAGNERERRIHPTQKPVALYRWLLTNYAKPGDRILDTHLGSGSSRIAAYDLGFDFVGYELDEDYFEAQEKRFQLHLAQPKLFVPSIAATEQGSLI